MREHIAHLEAVKNVQPSALALMKAILAVLDQAIIQVPYLPQQGGKKTAQIRLSGDQQLETLEALEDAALIVLDEWMEVIDSRANPEDADE